MNALNALSVNDLVIFLFKLIAAAAVVGLALSVVALGLWLFDKFSRRFPKTAGLVFWAAVIGGVVGYNNL